MTPAKPPLRKRQPRRRSPHRSQSWPCAATTARAARKPKQRLQPAVPVAVSVTVAMADVLVPVARVALVIAATVGRPVATRVAIAVHRPAASAIVRRASKIAVRASATQPSVRSAKRSNAPTWRCASSQHRRMAKP